jgi:DNA segregation ATPase FtsK/SpoIIIE, S-DNA-T family
VSSHPGIKETLELLGRLRETIHEFAAREEKLTAALRSRTAAEKKTFEAGSTAQESRATEAVAGAEAGFERDRQRAQSRFELRKTRINQGHMASRKRALDAIRDQEGKRKYKVQAGTLSAERQREANLAAAVTAYEEFQARLSESRNALGQLEQTAHRRVNGYGVFQKRLARDGGAPPEPTADADKSLEQLQQLNGRIGEALGRLKRVVLMRTGRYFPIWLSIILLLIGGACLVPAVQNAVGKDFPAQPAGIGILAAAGVLIIVRLIGRFQAGPAVNGLAGDLARARRLHDACFEQAELRFRAEQEQIKGGFETTTRGFDQEWKQATREAINLLDARPKEIDEQALRVTRKSEQLYRARLQQLERDQPNVLARLRQEGEAGRRQLAETHAATLAAIAAEQETAYQQLEAEWKNKITPVYETIRAANAEADALFPEWREERWKDWQPPREFRNLAKFGRLEVEVQQLVEKAPQDPRLAVPAGNFSLPLSLTYPQHGSLFFETGNAGAEDAMRALNNIIFRLLSTTPPGKLSFTIFDPVGLGQNFAGLMHLADYEESHINSRIWTQTNQLEEKLAELNEHMEKVIQMYLRNEYATIAEYNAQAGTIAEKYHFLVIADFPVNFSDTAARRLINIATSGARCGVYTLIQWDKRHALPPGFVPEELRKQGCGLIRTESGFKLDLPQPAGTRVVLDPPPTPEFATEFLHRIGEFGKDSNRVEVPFDQVAPPDAKLWTESTTDEVRVAIGRSGATKLQYLEIGRGTRQHALIAGKTGSGKSTLFHVIVTNLSLWCSPEEVEFYLVDFKKGVEFKGYATRRLPHARVVAIESDREFGLSVLQRVDEELRRRGDLFRQAGVQDLASYRRSGGKELVPRSLLMIDEFQEFFTEEDRVSQGAAVLLDRIVRQGRAFGIHVLLGSQTLGGAYTLARATIGQMVIRVALQCNEADAYLIMDQDNPAPRLLSRPGEGIYNDTAGSIEGNSPFQAVWLSEPVRDRYLTVIRARADRKAGQYPGPFVFEGNAPADVRDNLPLNAQLQSRSAKAPAQPRVWLGAPNAVKGPTEAVFQRQSGSNLLIVGQSEEPALAILSVALVSLAAQYPKGAARFFLLDSAPPGLPQREFLDRLVRGLAHEVVQVKAGDLSDTMNGLADELKKRAGDGAAPGPEIFVVIQGLQNFKKLKPEDEFGLSGDATSPAAVLMNLLTDGPAHGIHVVASFDSYNNVNRFFGRKAMSEFEMRVLFQMSASDSASLIDDPAGSTLGLHRALFYNDREGYLETFRPYALPGNDWVEEVARHLKRSKS